MAEIRIQRQPKEYSLVITLVDQDGEPVIGATAKIADDQGSAYTDDTTTDTTGTAFWNREVGTYYIQISGDDFQTVEYVAELKPNQTLVWEREGYYR